MRIWKWSLTVTDIQSVSMPAGAKLLTVQVQGMNPQIWALCDEAETTIEPRRIAIYGTGNPMPADPGKYIATFQLNDGELVFHAFELE